MSALREAAQQALEALETLVPTKGPSIYNSARDALRAVLAQQAEPVEPVAWRHKPMIGSSWSLSDDGYYISCKRDKGHIVDSLYTAPPQRKLVPLTEDDIDKIFKHLCNTVGASYKTMARAVEKASWEKNNG